MGASYHCEGTALQDAVALRHAAGALELARSALGARRCAVVRRRAARLALVATRPRSATWALVAWLAQRAILNTSCNLVSRVVLGQGRRKIRRSPLWATYRRSRALLAIRAWLALSAVRHTGVALELSGGALDALFRPITRGHRAWGAHGRRRAAAGASISRWANNAIVLGRETIAARVVPCGAGKGLGAHRAYGTSRR